MDLLSILDGTPEPPIVDLHLAEINTSGEYHLAAPMFEFQKELTDQIVSLHYPDIFKYCETNDATELIQKSLEICVDNCLLVSTHPYLLIQHYSPKNLTQRDLPSKLAETSGKFNVLKNLLNVIIRNSPQVPQKHVALVMKNDNRLFDLVDALLLGCNGPKTIYRYLGNNIKKDSAKVTKANGREAFSTCIHLIPSDGELSRKDLDLSAVKFDLLIVVDGRVDTSSDFFTSLRTQNRLTTQLPAVVLHVVPMYSIEHCLLRYNSLKSDKSYLYKLISSVVCLRDKIGYLPPDLLPIYNQHLSYLSHTVFDHVFGDNHNSFPPWPLPELSEIPSFSPKDVERSLLTEVVYHYTPYDSSDSANESFTQKEKSYYDTKRLQSDYVTNPLKNDYTTLSGIHNLHATKPNGNSSILTHLLISELNADYLELATLEEEIESYRAFNEPQKQRSFGRRVDEIRKTLSSIVEEVDHAEQRLQVTNRKILKRGQENEELMETQKRLKADLEKYSAHTDAETSSLKDKFSMRQLKIWELQNELKAIVSNLKLKGEEKDYMINEVKNCDEAVAQSENQISSLKEQISELEKKIQLSREQQTSEEKLFKQKKTELADKVYTAESEYMSAKAKLGKVLSYLRDTSHLKKRKGRGLTPNAR